MYTFHCKVARLLSINTTLFIMPAIPLYHLAKKACIKNIKCKHNTCQLQQKTHIRVAITDVGGAPYELLRPVLLKLENPDQLVKSRVTSFIRAILTNLPRENSRNYPLNYVAPTQRYGETSSSGTSLAGRQNHTNHRIPRTGTKSTISCAPRIKRW